AHGISVVQEECGGHGVSRQRDFWVWQQHDRPAVWVMDRGQWYGQRVGGGELRRRTDLSLDLGWAVAPVGGGLAQRTERLERGAALLRRQPEPCRHEPGPD